MGFFDRLMGRQPYTPGDGVPALIGTFEECSRQHPDEFAPVTRHKR